MAFDDDRIAAVGVQPLGLPGQHLTPLVGQRMLIHREQHPVADPLVEMRDGPRIIRVTQTRGVNKSTAEAAARTTGTIRATSAATILFLARLAIAYQVWRAL